MPEQVNAAKPHVDIVDGRVVCVLGDDYSSQVMFADAALVLLELLQQHKEEIRQAALRMLAEQEQRQLRDSDYAQNVAALLRQKMDKIRGGCQ